MTRPVLFDVDGVLIHSRFHPDTARRRFWDEHLLTDMGVEPKRFQTLFGPVFEDVIAGKRSLVAVLDDFLPTVGFTGSTMSFVTYWLERDAHINYALLDAIRSFRRRHDGKIYLATNQEHLRAAYLWRQFRFEHVFDDMLYAARLGAMKPNPAFFQAAAKCLPQSDEPPILFDDSKACVEAANAYGWQGVLFNHLEDFTHHAWVAPRIS